MHELSIANSIVEIVTEHAMQHHAEQVQSIQLKLGALTCVHPSALEFCFEQLTKETMLEGAKLEFLIVPVKVYCKVCECEMELPDIQHFCCPQCGTPSGELRAGQELEVETIELTAAEV